MGFLARLRCRLTGHHLVDTGRWLRYHNGREHWRAPRLVCTRCAEWRLGEPRDL